MPSAKLLKGALTYTGPHEKWVQSVMFQFNPETLTRLQVYSENANTITESIRFQLVLNAMEGMDLDVPAVVENGIYSQLAALEELLVQQTKQQHNSWFDWLFPSKTTNFLVLMYGERIIPVTLKRLNLKELLHNSQLKPIHATVDVTLRVLSERDLRGNAAGLATLGAYKQYRHLKAQTTETTHL